MRIYPVDETGGGFSVVDVLIGKYNDNWYLDVGFDLRNTIRTDYQLNESQIDDVANGSLTVLVIKISQAIMSISRTVKCLTRF